MKVFDCPIGSSDLKFVAKVVAEKLHSGSLVILPTESVYGIGCSASCTQSVNELYRIKRREREKRLSLHIGDRRQIDFPIKNPLFKKLTQRFWPGPLTIIVKHPMRKTMGLRYPSHPVFQSISREFAKPLFLSSANVSGDSSPNALRMIPQSILNVADVIVDSGMISDSQDSSVIDISDSKKICFLREGSLSFQLIRNHIDGK